MDELHTQRLRLRRWRLDDAQAAWPIYGDPEVTRYIGGHTARDVDEVREQLARRIARTEDLDRGLGSWAVLLGDQLVGCGLLKPLPDAQRDPTSDIEVGWHLGRAHWGNGYASEVGAALLVHGFDTLRLPEIHAVVEPPNTASMRVAQRIGMAHLGRTQAYYGIELEHFLIRSESG
ncbi:MAG: GNAT family N-acetyltransferase [Myxococcales bacterium]|nr:GNAT family N-acetyltransferase [Myxococcales bacterium]